MDKSVKITPEQLAKAMDADYQKLVQLVSGAVNGAPDGAVISGSEELVRDAMARCWIFITLASIYGLWRIRVLVRTASRPGISPQRFCILPSTMVRRRY